MAKLAFATHHHRHSFAMRLLEFGMGIDIDHLDIGTQLNADRPERDQEIVTKVAPSPTIDSQPRLFPICCRRHS